MGELNVYGNIFCRARGVVEKSAVFPSSFGPSAALRSSVPKRKIYCLLQFISLL
jgi:hypothetical protein